MSSFKLFSLSHMTRFQILYYDVLIELWKRNFPSVSIAERICRNVLSGWERGDDKNFNVLSIAVSAISVAINADDDDDEWTSSERLLVLSYARVYIEHKNAKKREIALRFQSILMILMSLTMLVCACVCAVLC